MKAHVNLLEELTTPTRPPVAQLAIVLVMALGLLAPIVLWGVQVRAANRLDPHIGELKALRDRLSQEVTDARQSVQEVAVQSTHRATPSASSNGTPWSEVLRELSVVVPDGVWLTELEEAPRQDNATDDDASVRLRGIATSQSGVVELLTRLETARRFATPTLVYTQQVSEQNHRVQFEIGCVVRRVARGETKQGDPA